MTRTTNTYYSLAYRDNNNNVCIRRQWYFHRTNRDELQAIIDNPYDTHTNDFIVKVTETIDEYVDEYDEKIHDLLISTDRLSRAEWSQYSEYKANSKRERAKHTTTTYEIA